MNTRANPYFESTLDKLIRTYMMVHRNIFKGEKKDINLVIEGNRACTDGKTIWLPCFEDVSEEFYTDLNGFVDHELGHCLWTQFEELPLVRNAFHHRLLNTGEDFRIERLQIQHHPGMEMNLKHINLKWKTKAAKTLREMRGPWTIRLLIAIDQIICKGDAELHPEDEQLQMLLPVVKPLAKQFPACTSTADVRILSEKIIDAVNKFREGLAEDMITDETDAEGMDGLQSDIPLALDPNRKDRKGREAQSNQEMLDPAAEKRERENKDGEGEDGDKKEGEGENGKEGAGNEIHNPNPSGKLETRHDYARWEESDEDKKAWEEGLNEKDSVWDGHVVSPESYMESRIKEEVKEQEVLKKEKKGIYANAKFGEAISLPYTRAYDKVHVLDRQGDVLTYAAKKREVMRFINPIRLELERVLLVKENRRVRVERERGQINPRALPNLKVNPNYRTIFKEYTRQDTKNIALTLVLDCSGSMQGTEIEIARRAGIAFAETLKAMRINFEVLGFNTGTSHGMYSESRAAAGSTRFNRFGTTLENYVFKSFDCESLTGIIKAEADGCNADGESITWAAKRLALRPEKRKVMIVLSDGQPSYGGANHEILAGDLKRVIRQLPLAGIEPIGIGICSRDVEKFYPEWVVINDINQLPTTVVKKVSEILRRGLK